MTKTIPSFLLPCPFCGHDLDAQWDRPNPKARCLTESCKGRQLPVLNLDQPDDIAAWNHRAPVDYAALMNSMTAILEHLGLDPANMPSGSYSEIVIGAMQVRRAETQRLLSDLAEWIDDMPVPTRGATAMLQRIDKAQQVAHTQPDPLSQILDLLKGMVNHGRAEDALTIATSAFVSLLLNYMRACGHDTDREITVSGGNERDITVHAPKSTSAA